MVHPTELLRTDSAGEGSFIAPVGDYRNDVDCGCKVLPCLSERLNLEKYAKPGVFVGVLAMTGLLNGLVVKYFRGTSQVWSKHYQIPQDTIDWLVYTNEIFVGIFALAFAYWGNKSHRPSWLGALTIYLGVSCITLAVPEIYQPYNTDETDITNVNGRGLCERSTKAELKDISADINNQFVAFGILILYQIVYALCTISFVTHGVTYIDDNISPKHSPAYLALVFGAQRMGKQVGIYSSWMPYVLKTQSIFVSTVWLIVAIKLIVLGCLLAMFPKVLPNTLLRKSVHSLLSLAAGNRVEKDNKTVDGFFVSFWRIVKNKVLLLNILSVMFMQAAIINFSIREKNFNQSKYHVSKYNDASGYSDPALIQFTTNLLKQPLIAFSYITTGMIIAKLRPRAKYLIMWNIKIFLVMALGFAGIRFFSCTNKLKNEPADKLVPPYCSWDCGCSPDGPFQPVCLNGDTYFSPCWAGCITFDSSLKIYQNCTCGTNDRTIAADGSCDSDNCSTLWALAQGNSVISAGLFATTFITTLVINLRCVASKDKALALAYHLTFVSLIPHLPVRALFDFISDIFCQIDGTSSCQFYSEHFAIFLSSATLILKALAIICAIILLFFIDKIELYTNNTSKTSSNIDVTVQRRYADNIFSSRENNMETLNNLETSEEPGEAAALIRSPSDILLRNSDSKLDSLGKRSSKNDRVSSYLSEGALVPPLKPNLRKGNSQSRTSNSNTSVLSTDSSLSAIANTVGDDHDSEFGTLPRMQRIRKLEKQLRTDSDASSLPDTSLPSSPAVRPSPKLAKGNIIETEF